MPTRGHQLYKSFLALSLTEKNIADKKIYYSMVTSENEAMLFCDITPLIAPRVELLRIRGVKHFEYLHGHINTAWGKNKSLIILPPQPDYCVGLCLDAFTAEQNQALLSIIGPGEPRNPLQATFLMFFPFFTCEAKAGGASLGVADRQNTSSGSHSVNALLTLYRAAGRERELDRKLLAFSISHDSIFFMIFGHYVAFNNGEEPRFYRYQIRLASFTETQDRWTAYRFTRNVYDKFAPVHYERGRSYRSSYLTFYVLSKPWN